MAREVGVGLRSVPRTLIKPSFCGSKQSNYILHWPTWNEVCEKLSWLVTVSVFSASVSTNREMMKTVQLVFHTVMIKTCFGNMHTFYCTALLNIYMDVFSFQHQIVKIIVWIIAFVLKNIIIQSAELHCLGLSLKNAWITFWFLQNQLFWGHTGSLCYDSTESFDCGKEGSVHFL